MAATVISEISYDESVEILLEKDERSSSEVSCRILLPDTIPMAHVTVADGLGAQEEFHRAISEITVSSVASSFHSSFSRSYASARSEVVIISDIDEDELQSKHDVPPCCSSSSSSTSSHNDQQEEVVTTTKFQRGDHVYQWCSVAGIPNVFQHHGIVMHVKVLENEQEELTIADFSNFLPAQKISQEEEEEGKKDDNNEAAARPPRQRKRRARALSFFREKSTSTLLGGAKPTGGIMRVYTTSANEQSLGGWRKVEYGAPRWKTILYRSGIKSTHVASDAPEVVLKRVNFLILQAERDIQNDNTFKSSGLLPKYHLFFANCECVATWCKTGKWCTLQAAAGLTGATAATALGGGTMAMGRAAIASEAVAATATSYFMGGAVAASSPVMAAYGIAAVGGSAGTLLLARSKWKATTKQLNEAMSKFDAEARMDRAMDEMSI